MVRVVARRMRAGAKVCAFLAFSALILFSAPARAIFELRGGRGELDVVVYPAKTPGPRPITVVLHGMCGDPLRTCAHFAEPVTERQHLVCPRASQRCEGAGASWSSQNFAEQIEGAVAAAERKLGPLVQREPGRTLIGYSLGAYRAAYILQQVGHRYPRAMLIGARATLSPRHLQRAGVARLVLSAGAWDMTYEPMRREAGRLAAAGVPARFVHLGAAGHRFSPTFGEYLRDALAWLDAPDHVG